jgi:hypothetical protein
MASGRIDATRRLAPDLHGDIARARAKGTRSGKAFGRPKLSAEREGAVRAALATGTGIRGTARLVGTGNATVARIAAEVRSG